MSLRGNLGKIAGAIGILLVCSGPASAKQLCFWAGSEEYFLVGAIPSKNTCNSFQVVSYNGELPGFLANGAMCTTETASTVLFTLSDGYFDALETVQGTFAYNGGIGGLGSANDCIAIWYGNYCYLDSVAITPCTASIAEGVSAGSNRVRRSMGD